jgi:diaminohydroxyphosphoribosylaminopyrimidine deaminase / 5-amino-6-(5-phosphoribosylamino)uracil reductase
VAGAGIARLRAAGMEVDVADGDLAIAARELNVGFLSRIERGRPWVRLKLAASLDGFTALPDGRSQWITGPQARADGHAWRRRAGAVLTGIGTVLADDPRLDVRLVPTDVQPLRVVLDTQGRMPANARITQTPGSVLVFTAHPRAQASGVTTEVLPTTAGRLDLKAVLARLTQLNVNELHVEAGAELSGAFLADGLVDELLVYIAPRLLGQGRAMASLSPALNLDIAPDWTHLDQASVGTDLRLRLRHRVSGYFTNPTHPA